MSKAGITPKAKTNLDPIDKIVNERVQDETQGDIHRVAFNMPQYIYEKIQPDLKKKKITMTNYILSLIRKDIGEV